jgi:hypothetical protein
MEAHSLGFCCLVGRLVFLLFLLKAFSGVSQAASPWATMISFGDHLAQVQNRRTWR